MFQVGGYEPATVIDFDLPEGYGLQQTIADTVGIGGIMRGLRTVPALVEVAEAMKRRCPAAVLLNYANPMAINLWGLAEFCEVEVYGLVPSTVSSEGLSPTAVGRLPAPGGAHQDEHRTPGVDRRGAEVWASRVRVPRGQARSPDRQRTRP